MLRKLDSQVHRDLVLDEDQVKIKERFDREGVEIPFPHRTIVYKEAKKKES